MRRRAPWGMSQTPTAIPPAGRSAVVGRDLRQKSPGRQRRSSALMADQRHQVPWELRRRPAAPAPMAAGDATRSSRSGRPRALGTSWPPRDSPGSSSQTRTLASLRVGLLSEPGRGFLQDFPFLAQHPVLTPQPHQPLPLLRGQPVGAPSLVQVRLSQPVPDRLRRRLELPGEPLRLAPTAHKLHYAPPKLRRVGRVRLATAPILLQLQRPRARFGGGVLAGSAPQPCAHGRPVADAPPLSIHLYSTWRSGAPAASPSMDSAVRLPLPVMIKARALPETQPGRLTISWMTAARLGVC